MKSPILTLLPVLGASLALGACASLSGPPLDNQRVASIHAGLTQDDVRGIAGRPANVTGAPRAGGNEWIYPFTDLYGYASELDVTFDGNGRVVDTYAQRLDE
ncbi:MAG TPA: outer membrane protein assembly factor BamE [Usitatibacter sp.]|jgi:outer membrane protein assembly factor BamE (lipoprotein component of BamABCDE complex)|nr:outer membrane protein assembly factor BamE [Usitatibacter sp.]